jgi:ABC-type polar amino acid transport system ATPase subunit
MMDEGLLVEEGHPVEFFARPAEARTQAFLDAVIRQ